MTKEFSVSERVQLEHRGICPDCVGHKQIWDMSEVGRICREEDTELDCKNLFLDENGQVVAQCCCYSLDHHHKFKEE